MARDRRSMEYQDNKLVVCDGQHGPHQPCVWRDATPAEVVEYYHAGKTKPRDKGLAKVRRPTK